MLYQRPPQQGIICQDYVKSCLELSAAVKLPGAVWSCHKLWSCQDVYGAARSYLELAGVV